MKFSSWDLPVQAAWSRSNDLVSLQHGESKVIIVLEEEDTGKLWQLKFGQIKAFRVTAHESFYATALSLDLPVDGGFLRSSSSAWMRELGVCKSSEGLSHFIVRCYDEVIEVVAREVEVLEQT